MTKVSASSQTSGSPDDGKGRSIQEEKEKPETSRHLQQISIADKILRTAFLYFVFFGFGLCVSITGPTLQDLASGLNVDIKKFTFIYSARSGGGIAGCLLAGVICDRMNRLIILGAVVLINSIATALIPWCTSMETVIITMIISGVCLGLTETTCNVVCLTIWQGNCGPYMQALHFCFGVGGFIGPLIAAPFLKPARFLTDTIIFNNDSSTMNTTTLSTNTTTLSTSYIKPLLVDDNLLNTTKIPEGYYAEYSFGIVGIYYMVIFLFFVYIYCKNSYDPKQTSKDRVDIPQQSNSYVVLIVGLVVIYFILYAGIEIGFAQLIATYAVICDLHLSKSTGSYLTSLYWGCFMFSRCFSIILSVKFKPLKVISIQHIIWSISGVILIVFGNSSEILLWIGTALFGFGLGPLFASVCAWLERMIFLSSVICCVFTICCSIGEMLFPFLLGQLIVINPSSMMYISLVSCILTAIILTIAWMITEAKRKRTCCFQLEDQPCDNSERL